MIEFDQKTFQAATAQLDNMVDGLDGATKKSSRDSLYRAIQDAIDREMINPVLQRAKQYGRNHVGDRVETIHPVGGRWEGNTYRAGLHTDNEVVLSHEFGSGSYGGRGPYMITPNSAEKLSFMIDGRPIVVDYVVHPGVRGKRFMQRAVRERSEEIAQEALDESQQTLNDALSPR